MLTLRVASNNNNNINLLYDHPSRSRSMDEVNAGAISCRHFKCKG